ncbi:MAG: hypothetical protein Q9186_001734 [Xanthomendoza sp. 1 TL-2023]
MPGTVSDADLALLSHPHNYYNNPPSNAWKVSVTDSIGLGLVTIVVAARCFTKLRVTKALGWEDFISVLTWIMFIAFSTLNFVQRFRFGGGRHTWDLPPEFYNGFLRTSTSSSYLYMLGTMLAKISLLLFLYRIFSVDRKFRIAAWALGTILVGWTIISFFLRIFACRPIKASWDVKLQLDPETRCNPKSYNTLNVHGICNIITDFGLLLLPVPMVWKLQMSLKKKLGVAAVFATGAIICAIAIVRQYIVWTTPKAGDNWLITKNKIWCTLIMPFPSYFRLKLTPFAVSIEFSLSIVVSCLPALAPFFRQFSVLASLIPSSIRSKFSSHSSSSDKRGQPWAAHKLPGSSTQSDVERGAVRSEEHKPHSSWRVPRAWHERSYDDYDRRSETSEMTLQPVLPTNREIKHGD